jgi:1-acyl-sn-glycerol-3-phosphate acyltransferase
MWAVVPALVRAVGRAVWRLRIDASSGFPSPPFVIAANHFSFLDAFLIAAAHRRKIRFLALVDLFGNYRTVDVVLVAFDVIPIRRGGVPLGPVREALDHLAAGGVVGLFPEGTRHWNFDPLRAKRGAAWLAARAGVPLVPVAIAGTDRVLGVDNRLHRSRIRVTIGPAMIPAGTDRAAADALTGTWGRWVATTLGTTQGGGRRW